MFSHMFVTLSLERRRRALCVASVVVFVLAYLLLLYWFDSRDFYHRYFFEHWLPVRHYQWARLTFILFFCWLIYAAGAMTMRIVAGADSCAKIPARERFPLGFLIGVAVWSMLLFLFGLAGLYGKLLAFAITILVILVSLPELVD